MGLCAVVLEGSNVASRSYTTPCNRNPFQGRGGGQATAEVADGIFSNEVISLDGVSVWRGEPAGDVSFARTIWYATSYFALSYLVSLGLLQRSRTHGSTIGWQIGMALMPSVIGGLMAWMAVMTMLILHGDLLLGMVMGMVAVIGMCLWINWREKRRLQPTI